jgi:septum formation protein
MTVAETLGKLNEFDIILASKSPRRQHLLSDIGIKFRIVNHIDMDEVYPAVLKGEEIPLYLAGAKASQYHDLIEQNTLLITADTIVWLENEVLGKPYDAGDAVKILYKLSGKMHEVFTGVCLKTANYEKTFYSCSRVFFRELSDDEITYYVDRYKPFDKAGAYGVQEWIGFVGIEKIEGSYYNVMGLPVQQLYCELVKLITS